MRCARLTQLKLEERRGGALLGPSWAFSSRTWNVRRFAEGKLRKHVLVELQEWEKKT